jgi:hypothetical protein
MHTLLVFVLVLDTCLNCLKSLFIYVFVNPVAAGDLNNAIGGDIMVPKISGVFELLLPLDFWLLLLLRLWRIRSFLIFLDVHIGVVGIGRMSIRIIRRVERIMLMMCPRTTCSTRMVIKVMSRCRCYRRCRTLDET